MGKKCNSEPKFQISALGLKQMAEVKVLKADVTSKGNGKSTEQKFFL